MNIKKIFDKRKISKLNLVELVTAATDLLATEEGRKKAIALYEIWLEDSSDKAAYAARFNFAVLLTDDGQYIQAQAQYEKIIRDENPALLQAYVNLGNVFERLLNPDAAIEANRQGETVASRTQSSDIDMHTMLLNNLGRLLENKFEYEEAEANLTKSLLLNPEQPPAIQHWVHLRQKLCKWPVYEPIGSVSVEQQLKNTSMLAVLAATDDPRVQLEIAKSYAQNKVRQATEYFSPSNGYNHSKIRLGYLSSDLCTHAVGILTAEMYGLHDRNRFEVFAFCWSREDGTLIQERIRGGIDRLIRIHEMTDEQAARCICDNEIDVLIDLHGLTNGTRHNILTYRPAPIQITYLGLPATTGITEIDYVIADDYVLPENIQPYFTEKPLYINPCFQVNDRERQIGEAVSRTKYGLPEDKFVFCSFNNTYKITQEMFGIWLRIIQQVENSILWIMSDNPWATENLKNAADTAGIALDRIHFAGRIPPAEYLARYQCADLFLDAFPFNGGTTASDSLWAGLPVLTLSGRSFASRYAGSLLRAVGLEELITEDLNAYEQRAIEIATTPRKSDQLKQILKENRDKKALFDTPSFVQTLDNAIEKIVRSQIAHHPVVMSSASVEGQPANLPKPEQQEIQKISTSENTYVVLVEPDLEELGRKIHNPTEVDIVYFDPALEDKLVANGFSRSRFYDVSALAEYSELHKQSGLSALAAGQQLHAALGEIYAIPNGFNWHYETLLYTYMYSTWYRLLGRYLAQNYEQVFGERTPVFLIYDNPAYLYFHSFIPAVSVTEVLAGSGHNFDVFNYGQGESPANGVTDVVPDLFTHSKMEQCSLLFHLPTVMYDKEQLEQYIKRFNPSEILGIAPHYWDQFIANEQTVPLIWTKSVLAVLPPELANKIEQLCNSVEKTVELILQEMIATPFIRQRQVKFFVDFARSQFITLFAMEVFFTAGRPKQILMADHDTGFHGPITAFACNHGIPVTTFPHAKVSFHFPYASNNVRCLVHPVQGERLPAVGGGEYVEERISFPESLVFDTSVRRKIKTVGIVLNAMSGHGVLLRSLDEYMGSLKSVVDLLRAHDVTIKLRSRPGQTLYHRIAQSTGISIEQQAYGALGSISDWGGDIDLCIMYDTPTSGQIEFLKRSIPIVHLVLSDCAEWERNIVNEEIVPSLTLAEISTLLRNLIQSDQAYLDFRKNQFVAYVSAHCSGSSLQTALRAN